MNGPTTPGEVEVGLADLRDLIAACDDDGIVPTILSLVPFDTRNNAIFADLVSEWGDQPSRTFIVFASRRATWQLMQDEVWG